MENKNSKSNDRLIIKRYKKKMSLEEVLIKIVKLFLD